MASFSRPRTNTSFDLVVRNLVVDNAVIDGDTDGATVSYDLTHKGAAFGVGTLAWEAFDHEGAWADRFNLPGTPGVLVAEVTATVVGDDFTDVGRATVSVKVEP